MEDFQSTNTTIGALTVTIYLLGFALGPLLIAPLSELFGRLKIYHICNGVFLSFTIGCALSTNVGMFMGFRFLTGCAGSAPLTIGGGTVADVIPQEKRGAAMGIFAVGPLLGPVIGPIMGGFIAQNIGWRWTFWVLAIVVSFHSRIIPFILEISVTDQFLL
jgi:multidrug resistance protein